MSNQPKIKVLSVSTRDNGGGAANAAFRIHCGVNALCDDVQSTMFVKKKVTDNPKVIPLDDFIPHNVLYRVGDWIATKVKNKVQHVQWNRYPDRANIFMSDLRSTRIHGALQKLDYDVLHLHWFNQRFLSLEDLPKDKPIVWTLHDSWAFTGVCHIPYECKGYQQECGCCPMLHSNDPHDLSHKVWAEKKRLLDGLDLHIVTPSKWLADCARSSSLFKDADIRVIPNCLNTDFFSPGDREEACKLLNLNPNKRYLLYGAVNALTDSNKGFRYLQCALQQNTWPDDLELVVLGADQPIDSLSSIPAHYMGYLGGERLVAAYRVASVVVVPSLSENLSCAIMEALSCGTHVCCFNIGGNRDMVEHQVNGYLAQERNSEDLAIGISWCLEHDYQVSARESVLSRYTIENISMQYVNLYEELFNK